MKRILRYTFLLLFLLLPSTVLAADLEITCYEDQKPTISQTDGYLFDLDNFMPGHTSIKTVRVDSLATENNCKIYFQGSGSKNTLTDSIYIAFSNTYGNIVDSKATSNKNLSQFLDEDRVIIADLNPGETVQRDLILTYESDANNSTSNMSTDFNIRIITEWGNETEDDPDNEDILGEEDRARASKPVTSNSNNSYNTQELGIGGADEEVEEEVKGTQSCDEKKKLFGYVYIERNSNGVRDEKEKVLKDVSLKIFGTVNENQITIVDLVTDENGYWETYLCPGEYKIEINRGTLPPNIDIEDNIQSVVLAVYLDELGIDIPVYDSRNFLQKYWPYILAVLLIAIIASIIYFLRKRRSVREISEESGEDSPPKSSPHI